MEEYYDRRAPEYDDWYLGRSLFAERDRPGWHEEVEELTTVVAELPPARTLDVACGTGFAVSLLAACGGGAGLLSGEEANSLSSRLDQVGAAVNSGNCGAA